MGQQAAERQLRAELLLEVPEVAAGGQCLVHVLAEHILCHYAGLNVAVSLQKRRPAVRSWIVCCICSQKIQPAGERIVQCLQYMPQMAC